MHTAQIAPAARTVGASIFIVPNATFIAEVIAFILILLVMWRYVVPPLQKAMRERQETIRNQLEESQRARERMEQADAEHQRTLAEARAEATKIRENARAEAQRIIDETKGHAQAEVDRIRERGEEQLAAQQRQVVAELRHEIGQLAVQLAGRVVGESLEDEARGRRTVDRFLDELDGMAPPDGEVRPTGTEHEQRVPS